MIPSAETYSNCLRCRAALGADKTAPCPACGADPVIERQVYAQLTPAIRDLRIIFFGAALLQGLLTWLLHAKLAQAGVDTTAFLAVALAETAGFVVLGVLAPVAPLVTALIGLALVVASWLSVLVQHPVTALTPGPGMALTIGLAAAFLFAIKAGLTVRRLRAQHRLGAPVSAA